MVVTASELRQNVYRLLDQVLETGEALEIDRRGQRLRIVPVVRAGPSRFDAAPLDGVITGDPNDLVELDWSGEWQP